MAFPDTGSLDTFAGADENPIAANWTSPVLGGEPVLKVVSGELAANGAYGQAYWDAASFGPHVETWATVSTFAGDAYVGCRLEGGGSTEDGYWAWFNQPGSVVRIYRCVNSNWGQLKEVSGVTMGNGSSVGIRAISGHIEAWHKSSGGAWTLVAEQGDLSHPMPGYAGVMLSSTTDRISEVGGGTITPDFSASYTPGFCVCTRAGSLA